MPASDKMSDILQGIVIGYILCCVTFVMIKVFA